MDVVQVVVPTEGEAVPVADIPRAMLPDVTAVSPATLRRLELASGALAAACLAAMERDQPGFARLPADQRAGVVLVTQTGVANFVAWLGARGESIRLTAEAFRIAPRDLADRLSLRQTVDLVRIATDVFERHLPPLAADEAERRALVEGILRFGREIAFAAATVYAGAAETRGAWDARQEALVVDAVVRGETDDALVSRASALGWDAAAAVRVVVGGPSHDPRSALRGEALDAGRPVLVGVQGSRLIVLVAEPAPGPPNAGPPHSSTPHPGPANSGPANSGPPISDPPSAGTSDMPAWLADGFGPGPVVVGPHAPDLARAHASATEALSGLRAARGWPGAPRPVAADDLLPERALAGDATACARLVDTVVAPLQAAGGELAHTLEVYLEGGGALEACSRALFIHPNTVRYRLRRVSEVTGRQPTEARDALVLRTALIIGRLAG